MKAIWLEEHGGPENLKFTERPDPKPKGDEVVLEVKAGGLNHLDIWVRMGGARPFPLPLVPGTDVAGVVREVGELAELAVGDEVVVYPCVGNKNTRATENGIDPMAPGFQFLGAHRDGAFAELVAAPAANCVPKPASVSWNEAAAVPVNYITSWHMLQARAQLQPGETTLNIRRVFRSREDMVRPELTKFFQRGIRITAPVIHEGGRASQGVVRRAATPRPASPVVGSSCSANW